MGSIEEKIKEDRKKILPGVFAWLKKYWIIVLVAVLAQAGPGLYLGIYLADRPWFCALLCHNMVPHYETFAASRHGRKALDGDMTCMDCHAKPGFINHTIEHIVASQFMIPNITKPYLHDHLGTHDNVRGFDAHELDFRGKSFEEEEHLVAKCQEKCHTKRIGGSYFMQPTHHGYEIINNNCRRCHGLIADQAEPKKAKAKKLLYEVSPPNPWKYPEPQALPNVHPLHLGMNIQCHQCHSRIIHDVHADKKHTPGMERCFRCHNNKKAPRDNCPACHVNPRDLFAGIKGKGIEESPGYMVEIECMECHLEENDFKIVPQVCVDCHDDEDMPQNITEWRNLWLKNEKVATKNYKAVKAKITKWRRGGRSIATINKIFKKAEYNYLYAARDNSRGIHNPDFTEALFLSASDGFIECLEMMKR